MVKEQLSPLSGKAILFSLNIRLWTGRKLDRQITDEVNLQHNAEADAGRYNKLLIPKEAFAEVYQVTRTARTAHMVATMPWWDEGTRILPTIMYVETANRFRQFRTDFLGAADRFNTKYPHYKAAAKKRLNGMYKEEDYPEPSRVRGMFDFKMRISPCPDIQDFRVSLAKEHADDIKSNLEAELKSTLNDAMKEPVRRIIVVAEKMATKLKGYKPKTETSGAENTFRDSLVTNIQELLPLLDAFNLTGDKNLTALTQRIEKELCTVNASELREDEKTRKKVAKAAEEILKQASALMA